jgi:hypothetical protein
MSVRNASAATTKSQRDSRNRRANRGEIVTSTLGLTRRLPPRLELRDVGEFFLKNKSVADRT